MALGDILQVRLVCTQDEQVAINIRHYQISQITDLEPTRAQVATVLDNVYDTIYKDLINNRAMYRGVGVQRIWPGDPSIESTSAVFPGPGLGGPESLPSQVAGLIRFTGSVGGRRGRGRTYVPFPSETDNQQDSAPTTSYLARLNLLGETFATVRTIGIPGGSLQLSPVIVGRGPPITWNFLLGWSPSPYWATQRRRTRGRSTDTLPF